MTDITETALRARQMYLDGVTTARILEDTGLKVHELYYALDGKASKHGPQLLPVIPRRQTTTRKQLPGHTRDRLRLVRRVMRGAEKEMRAIEKSLGSGTGEGVRPLALLTRTLRELHALDETLGARKAQRKTTTTDDDAVPQDLDELRRELARRLAQIVDGRNR